MHVCIHKCHMLRYIGYSQTTSIPSVINMMSCNSFTMESDNSCLYQLVLFFPCTRLEIKFIISYLILTGFRHCRHLYGQHYLGTAENDFAIPVACRINTGLGFDHHIVCRCASTSLRWRHNGRDGISNHQPHVCLLNSYSGADQRKHQSSASLAFVLGIHRGPVNSPHKWPVTRKMFPFDDVIIMRVLSHHQVQFRLKN